MVTDWNDFFLSYTNKKTLETNNDFKKMIMHSLKAIIDKKEWEEKNCLAHFIVDNLYEKNLFAFFDRDVIKNGEEIAKKVYKHCDTSFSFIQLVDCCSLIRFSISPRAQYCFS